MRALTMLALLLWLCQAPACSEPAGITFRLDPAAQVFEDNQVVAQGDQVYLAATGLASRTLCLHRPGYADLQMTLEWSTAVGRWRLERGEFLAADTCFRLQPERAAAASAPAAALAVPLLVAAAAAGAMRFRRRPRSPAMEEEYDRVRLLGDGGGGTVYEAVRRSDGSRWALKVLHPCAGHDPEYWRRFEREATLCTRLHHPGVVKLHSWGVTAASPYLVMELVEGETLRAVLQRGPLPLADAVGCLIDILHAMRAAHVLGIVHRDLKPENLMVTPGGRVRVMDLGCAVAVSGTSAGPAGTPRYMAPEQFDGAPPSCQADIYALGTIAYEMLTGHPPFLQTSVYALMTARMTTAPLPLQLTRPDVPAPLAAWLARMLAPDPMARPADAGIALRGVMEALACTLAA